MGRIEEFEGLRGLMALWVVLGHVSNSLAWTVPAPLPKNLSGRSAVDVFIILSGFVITLLLLNKRERYLLYLTRRIFRLFPVYFVCLLGSVALLDVAREALQMAPPTTATAGRLRMLDDGNEALWLHLGAHLTMLHGLLDRVVPNASFALLGQAWSVSVEFQFYLIAPAVVAALWHRSALAATAAIVYLAGLVAAAGATRIGALPTHLGLFALGIVYCQLWRRLEGGTLRWSAWQVRSFSLSMLVVGWWLMARPAAALVWVGAAHIVLSRVASPDSLSLLELLVSRGLRSPPALWLGQISYSVYLSHMIVLYPVLWGLSSVGASMTTQAVGLVVLVPLGTLGLSRMLYVWVERPFIKRGSALATRLGPSEPSAA